MRIRSVGLVAIGAGFLLFAGCPDEQKHELERKYDQLKIDMTAEEVNAIMGEGKSVTAAELRKTPSTLSST